MGSEMCIRDSFFSNFDCETIPKRLSAWRNTSANEIKKVFGILLYMGLVQKPSIEDYWSVDAVIHTPYMMAMECLSRDRFQIILRFLRFADYDEIKEDSEVFEKFDLF